MQWFKGNMHKTTRNRSTLCVSGFLILNNGDRIRTLIFLFKPVIQAHTHDRPIYSSVHSSNRRLMIWQAELRLIVTP